MPTDQNQFIIPEGDNAGVSALNRAGERSLYAGRRKVYPKLAHGKFRKLKWGVMAVTLGIYYAIPWVRWDRGPDMPNQAVLLDMQSERFFLFGLEIWPQEFYFVTGLLVLAALTLFLMTSIAGRVWCGYLCPQTVWTDLMIAVERFWQGDRNDRIRLDNGPWTIRKAYKKLMTHISWLLIALATGGAFVFYFADAPTLMRQLMTATAAQEAYMFIAILTFTTYLLGGIAREQVCIYMCPWPRIQGAMIDKDSYLISYREWRGEPRGPMQKHSGANLRGDCIDCKACIAVCPVSIDIRDGPQLECIQCALCIDACNDIMDRIKRPPNLIGYATIAGLEAERTGSAAPPQLGRPRTLLYLALIGLVGAIMFAALSTRSLVAVDILPDRNPLFVRLSDGSIRNAYTIKISNKHPQSKSYKLTVEGLSQSRLSLGNAESNTENMFRVAADSTLEARVFVTLPPHAAPARTSDTKQFVFIFSDEKGVVARNTAVFRGPQS